MIQMHLPFRSLLRIKTETWAPYSEGGPALSFSTRSGLGRMAPHRTLLWEDHTVAGSAIISAAVGFAVDGLLLDWESGASFYPSFAQALSPVSDTLNDNMRATQETEGRARIY